MSARLNAGVGTNLPTGLPTPLPTPLAAALETSGVHLPIPFLDLSAQVIRDLPLENVAALQRFIAEAKSELATLAAMVQTGLEMRYADAACAQLLAKGQDTGTTHIQDGDFDITVEVDKTVAWDQAELSSKWDRIGASGDDPRQYITAKFSVSESRFKAWPEVLRQQFESARTVTPGKPKFVLRRAGEGK